MAEDTRNPNPFTLELERYSEASRQVPNIEHSISDVGNQSLYKYPYISPYQATFRVVDAPFDGEKAAILIW
jgi:hypothetical protein